MSQDTKLLEQALTHTGQLLEQVTPGQYGLPTPCEEFDVRALVGHLLAGNPYYVVLARGGAPDFALFAHDHLGGRRPGEVYAEGAEEVLAAWRTEGALQRRTGAAPGRPAPAGGGPARLGPRHRHRSGPHRRPRRRRGRAAHLVRQPPGRRPYRDRHVRPGQERPGGRPRLRSARRLLRPHRPTGVRLVNRATGPHPVV
ncbi:maleylpyruvate isomerase N-terminal domain-containing protein [Streptomyces lavendulae]|uniref:maleylpyruvate isomerase N-terminal domain-containing protein n=1 Tax=Streptomyces lavendulae TaxID=1914 RepID=UPI003812ABE6